MSDLHKLSLSDTLKGLENGDFSAVEVTQDYLDEIERRKNLNAYITVCGEKALEMARQSDQRRANGTVGKLEGIPLGIKDLYCTKGIRTTAASKILSNFVPQYESTVTQKLWDAGAVLLGKTNTDEFAMGSSTATSYFGASLNPHDETKVPGGSSGGSGSAVGGFLCAGATGTETGGSIRHPSAFCKIAGIKPTYGRCSRYGIVAYASSLDTPGPMARNIKDASVMLEVMSGHDPKDSTSSRQSVPAFTKALDKNIKGMKIGIPKEYQEMIPDNWESGLNFLKEQGAELVEVSLPHTEDAAALYYIIAMAEASSNLARYDGIRYGMREDGDSLDELYMNTRMAGFGDEVRKRMIMGTYFLSAKGYADYFVPAQKARRLIANDFVHVFKDVDVLVAPSVPVEPFTVADAIAGKAQIKFNDTYLMPSCLAGVPAACANNGLQVIGNYWDEERVLKVADVLEDLK